MTEEKTEEKAELIEQKKKDHIQNSIVMKVQQFQRWAELIEEPEHPDDVKDLLDDIANHGKYLYEYIKRLMINSEELSEKAKMYAEAARTQKNKAKSYKDYLTQAFKSAGYDEFAAGDLQFKLVESVKYVPRQAPSEDDFIEFQDFVDTKFQWKEDPDAGDFIDNQAKVNRIFNWKEAIIKDRIKAAQKVLKAKKADAEEKEQAQKELDRLLEIMKPEHAHSLRVGVRKL